jgi:CRISPR-associated protein Cmr2
LIQKKTGSPLFKQAFKSENSDKFEIPYLAEIATKRLEGLNKGAWTRLRDKYKGKDSNNDGDEDLFYQELKENFKQTYNEDYFSFYKYICIVQADGDNMGKIVSSISADNVLKVSEALLKYGKEACEKIKSYGGLPIYAGGDDLLFIAPVQGNDNTIFGLIDEIDKLYADKVDKSIGGFRPNNLHTYLSYGLSISYYKYPLYEAFKDALDLLFTKAKQIDGKDAVSWCLRKHSGSGFKGEMSKNVAIYNDFKYIMNVSVEEKHISAIAHKLKNNENLLDILLKKYLNENNSDDLKARLENFYKKTMEDTGDNKYTALTRELLFKLMCTADKKTEIETILENMYGMLRTAKFIKGEGDNDE